MLAIALMSSAMLIVPVMDIIAKYLSAYLPPPQITFGRFFFQFLICLVLAVGTGRLLKMRGHQPLLNYARGLLLATASLSFFIAVKYMSVATAISIFFVEPMILTIMAAVILKEPVGVRRISAIVVGLAGALIILRPNLAELGLVSLLPVFTAFVFACYLIINRIVPAQDDLLTIQFSAGLAGTVYLGTGLLIGTLAGFGEAAFVMPTLSQTGLLLIIGAISFLAHGLVVAAFQRGSASLLAPLQYLEIVSATLFGYLVFADFPDAMTWLGIALIIGSGLYITHRERLRRQEI
ncbi:DMT family transporter [Roseibium denhamense]|uniref:Threonine/homoserine efflux transporter RhtA n=2 Tax=Roseibium denhamense TaxID=76305 RepID=A0ABY1P1V3_9HYPH|nr:DMT family transporter [Roseibium denhamense]MTI07683.1 DMT family transporter [Roseibium denhamense]SMP24479.1 Threonine/homoserine efflux transporter RhtA [Roseibium denhamense]